MGESRAKRCALSFLSLPRLWGRVASHKRVYARLRRAMASRVGASCDDAESDPTSGASRRTLPFQGRDKKARKLRHPYSLRPRVGRLPLSCPSHKARGRSAKRRILFNPRLAACASLAKDARLSALHRGDFCPRGRTSGRGRAGMPRPLSGQLSPPFIRAASSHSRQSPIVGTDGDPGPPGSGVTSPARGRRVSSRPHDAS
jgi:hypothetical protein